MSSSGKVGGTSGGAAVGYPLASLLDSTYGLHANGVTADEVGINAALARKDTATYWFGNKTLAIAGPVIVPNGIQLAGIGGMQGGSKLVPTSAFPSTTVVGPVTTPASQATAFTLPVASTAGFPLGAGGITPPNGVGVLCVAGITIFYTATDATNFLNCQVQTLDTNVTIANGRAVSTFMVWLVDPGDATVDGYATRLDRVQIDDPVGIPGISAVHSCHFQEGSGIEYCNIGGFRNFGIRIDHNPITGGPAAQWEQAGSHCWMRMSGSAEAEAVAIDILANAALTANVSGRGIHGVTFVNKNNLVKGKAAVRLNGTSGRFGDFHFENHNVGVLVGDLAPCFVTLENLNQDSGWGTGYRVQFGNTAGNGGVVRNLLVGGTGTAAQMIKDDVNGTVYNAANNAQLSLQEFSLGRDGSAYMNWNNGAPNLNVQSNYLPAAATISVAGTYTDGPAVGPLPKGTWLLVGVVVLHAGSSAARLWTAKLWDGVSAAVSTGLFEVTGAAAAGEASIPLVGSVTSDGTKTFKISATSDTGTTDTIVSNGGTASFLFAIRVG